MMNEWEEAAMDQINVEPPLKASKLLFDTQSFIIMCPKRPR